MLMRTVGTHSRRLVNIGQVNIRRTGFSQAPLDTEGTASLSLRLLPPSIIRSHRGIILSTQWAPRQSPTFLPSGGTGSAPWGTSLDLLLISLSGLKSGSRDSQSGQASEMRALISQKPCSSWRRPLKPGEGTVNIGAAASRGLPGVGWSWVVDQPPHLLPGMGSPWRKEQRPEAGALHTLAV